MKIAYFDCLSGISGDMVIASLLDTGLDENLFREKLSLLNMDDFFELNIYKNKKGFLMTTKFDVLAKEEKKHRHMKDIYHIIDNSNLDISLKEKIKKIFYTLAEGESRVHNEPVENIHFHEVGAVDTVVDIAGTVIALDLLGIERICSSSLPLGGGFVTCSHGKIPVPAPATLEILKNRVPVYKDERMFELVTPTGAAIIVNIADTFASMPHMTVTAAGYGSGSYDSDTNYLRVFIGESQDIEEVKNIMIETAIDDMNPQIYDYVMSKLFSAGALDVTLTPLFMKKQRPAILLSVLIEQDIEGKIRDIIFKETSTIGYRKYDVTKVMMKRRLEKINTPLGEVRVKRVEYENSFKSAPEFDDCRKIAKETGMPLKDVMKHIEHYIWENHLPGKAMEYNYLSRGQ